MSERVWELRAQIDDMQERLTGATDSWVQWQARAEAAEARLEKMRELHDTLRSERDTFIEAAVANGKQLKATEAERDELRDAVERVREKHGLHECTGMPFGDDPCSVVFGGFCRNEGCCRTCRVTAPCPTIRALNGGDDE